VPTVKQTDFDRKIWFVVSQIKLGRVMSYGEGARIAGFPRHARMVSKAMRCSPEDLPWFRVVRADRSLGLRLAVNPIKNKQGYLKKKAW